VRAEAKQLVAREAALQRDLAAAQARAHKAAAREAAAQEAAEAAKAAS
jgi:hypothetical protein